MSAVVRTIEYGPEDYTLCIERAEGVGRSRIHTVDVGPSAGAENATHTTRDGLPMTVLYAAEHGYMVAVHTP